MSPSFLAGTGITLMGLGVIPIDNDMAAVANVFIGPLGIPLNVFLSILGPCQMLGVLSLWGYGPMPKSIAIPGLGLSALCGAIGHYVHGDIPHAIAATGYVVIAGTLAVLEQARTETDDKKDGKQK